MNEVEVDDVDDEQAWLAEQAMVVVDRAHARSGELGAIARQLLLELPPPLQDDRYIADLASGVTAAAVVLDPNGEAPGQSGSRPGPVAFVGGSVSRGRLQLDVLSRVPTADGDDELTATAVRLLTDHVSTELQTIDDEPSSNLEPTLELWTRPDIDHLAIGPTGLGLSRYRSLNQLRVALPVSTTASPTRAFDPDRDLENLVSVNNRAFAQHPDQSRQTLEDMSSLVNQSWFDNEGLRVLDDPDGSGAMAGFCWTKVHTAGHYHPTLTPDTSHGSGGHDDRLGEIFVIGLDPDFHGRGLGVPLVAAGLSWLASQGLTEALLFVEADNHPALRTYERLGFVLNRVDTAWRRL